MADILISSKAIRRVVLITADGERLTVHKKGKPKRKTSRRLRRLEKAQRQFIKALNNANDDYLQRHEKSSRKNKDGWLLDWVTNTARANWKLGRKLNKIRFV